MKEKITVSTPTYNRAKLLERVYKSLVEQTDRRFIWLVVDDGSTDSTENLIANYISENNIKIKYIKQANGGKHRAHNTGVKECETEYFFILDSDDFLNKNAIKKIYEILDKKAKQKNLGIVGCRYDYKTNTPMGTSMPKIEQATLRELYQIYAFKGDTALIFKTHILKQNLFPEIENEKFISENVVWDKICSENKLLTTQEILYYGEYQHDGYTNNIHTINKKNPIGYSLSLKSSIQYSLKLRYKIIYMMKYIIWCKRYDIEILIKKDYLYYFIYPISHILYILKLPKKYF